MVSENQAWFVVLTTIMTRLVPFHLAGNTLYSAASSNFLGTELVFQRHGLNPLKTEMKRSWFNGKLLLNKYLQNNKRSNIWCS